MKINSELPLSLLNENNELNEYDFVLFHLYQSNREYREYFLNQRKTNPDRLMILDNSAYEFFIKGENLDTREYRKCIMELKPDFYILPDVLMDKQQTLKNALRFTLIMLASPSCNREVMQKCKYMAVVQGNSIEDILDCINIYKSKGIKNIAIPFHNTFFKEIGNYADEDIQNEFASNYNIPVNDDMRYAMGRIQFVRNYFDILKQFEHVHFLGSHCPLEKMYYKDFQTMDTGYPVKCAIEGYELFKEPSKPNVIIDEFFDHYENESGQELIRKNINIFKSI